MHRPDPGGDRQCGRHLELGLARRGPAGRLLRSGSGCRSCSPGLAFGTATSAFTVIKRYYPLVIGVGGAVLIAMGVLIFTGEFTQLNITVSHWLTSLGLPDLNADT